MGIDVSLFVKTTKDYSEKELKDLNYRFLEACSLGYGKKPITKDGEVYRIDTLQRYYGINYARGSWPEIYMGIQWLLHNFENAKVHYGGDSYEIEDCPEFTEETANELNELWYTTGGLTYRQRLPEEEWERKICPDCDVVMSVYMWNGIKGRGVCCQGCGHSEETSDGGETWEIKKP